MNYKLLLLLVSILLYADANAQFQEGKAVRGNLLMNIEHYRAGLFQNGSSDIVSRATIIDLNIEIGFGNLKGNTLNYIGPLIVSSIATSNNPTGTSKSLELGAGIIAGKQKILQISNSLYYIPDMNIRAWYSTRSYNSSISTNEITYYNYISQINFTPLGVGIQFKDRLLQTIRIGNIRLAHGITLEERPHQTSKSITKRTALEINSTVFQVGIIYNLSQPKK